MMIAITGTPGTGKSTIAEELARRGNLVVQAKESVGPYVLGKDPERDTQIIDTDAWSEGFQPVDGFVEGHISHLLSADRVVVIRCRPDLLQTRLMARGYAEEKVRENLEAEILDVILVETLELHDQSTVYEVDCSEMSISQAANEIENIRAGASEPSQGIVDWLSDYSDLL